MLLQFSIENFMSFKDKVILSLAPEAGKELPLNIISSGKHAALKSAVILGANASGKSNIIKAFTAAIMLIRESNQVQIGQPLFRIVPFKFNHKSKNEPSSFEFIYTARGIKYIYGFSATPERITEEYLYAYYSAKPTLVFDRVDDTYSFNSDKKALKNLATKNSSNKLFLSTATLWNYEKTREPYLWFTEQIDTYIGNNWVTDYSGFVEDDDGSQKRFTARLLAIADINISDYQVIETDIPKEQIEILKLQDPMIKAFFESVPEGVANKTVNVRSFHTIEEGGKSVVYDLDLLEESQGTQQLFALSSILKKSFSTGKTVIIDELDAGLHPLLIEELVRMFHDPEVNKADAQVVFTTHAVSLLDLDLFRRDQVYFTEKNATTATSELFSLDEFSVRKSENIRNGYYYGRYGAIPLISKGDSPWE